MSDNTLVNEATDTSTNEDQAGNTAKTFTQDEVNAMIARAKGSVAKKYEKQYEDLGDPNELRSLKAEADKRKTEDQLKRGEFEKTLQELASKKDAEIAKRDALIAAYKVDTPLLEEASKFRAVKPEQVKALLKNNVRLNVDGEVEIVDTTGKVRYSDKGTPLAVSDLVQEFLNQNPHFVQSTPTTTNTKSSLSANMTKLDITKLDMTKPEHREIYSKYRKEHGIV
jgi:ribonucleotide reductase alpha subunit